jgi:hypothetical protein
MNKKSRLLGYIVLANTLVISGCVTLPGTYNFGPWVEYEAITLNDDGSFRYEWWSDDGGTQCEALGSWVELEGRPRSVQTTVVEQIIGAHEDGCIHLARTEIWEVKVGGLVRQGNQRFAKVRQSEG